MAEVNPMDVFAGIEDAPVYGSAQYIEPGDSIFEVKKVLLKGSDRDARIWFIAELETVESNREDQPVGSTRSEIIDYSKKETGPGNVKAFAMCLAPDLVEADITQSELAKLVSDAQPAAGVRIRCEAWTITTSRGNPFTKKRWTYATEHNGAQA